MDFSNPKPAKHRAIVYSVGTTYTLYLDLSDQEAHRRWAAKRADMGAIERAYELDKGYEVQKSIIEFDDELEIWGNSGKEMNEMAQMMISRLLGGGQE